MDDKKALIIGNSDGIGLSITRLLLKQGWEVLGISRSDSRLKHKAYRHHSLDVRDPQYLPYLDTLVAAGDIPVCIFCVGMGNQEEDKWWRDEAAVIEVNFLSAVQTFDRLLPQWLDRGAGHFIALSSLADTLHIADAPSYCSSKAGLSRFLEATGLRLKSSGVKISNVRFGFVDYQNGSGATKAMMITPRTRG